MLVMKSLLFIKPGSQRQCAFQTNAHTASGLQIFLMTALPGSSRPKCSRVWSLQASLHRAEAQEGHKHEESSAWKG